MAELLIEKEVIFTDDLERIFGKRPWASRADELMKESSKKPDAEVTTEEKPEEKIEEASTNE